MKTLVQAYRHAVAAIAKRATLKDTRHAVSAAEREANSNNRVYVAATNTKAGFVAYCEEMIAALEVAEAELVVVFGQTEREFFALANNVVRAAMINDAHGEALEINRVLTIESDLKAGRPVCEETGRDLREWSGASIEAAHAEALQMNANRDQHAIKERAARAARYSAAWVGVVTPQQLDRFVEVANNRPAGYDPHSMRVTVTAACKELINRTQWSA